MMEIEIIFKIGTVLDNLGDFLSNDFALGSTLALVASIAFIADTVDAVTAIVVNKSLKQSRNFSDEIIIDW